jgi:hypothetical protein
MSLNGKYYCAEIKSSLVIENANNANGQANGTFELDTITIPVNIHYHFENNVGPKTNLWFAGNLDNPNEYVGGAGLTQRDAFTNIQIAGGYPVSDSVKTFEGKYVRQ